MSSIHITKRSLITIILRPKIGVDFKNKKDIQQTLEYVTNVIGEVYIIENSYGMGSMFREMGFNNTVQQAIIRNSLPNKMIFP